MTSRKQAIREKCLNCMCFQHKEVRDCPAIDCPLWHYRMGRIPKKTSQKVYISEEKKEIDGKVL